MYSPTSNTNRIYPSSNVYNPTSPVYNPNNAYIKHDVIYSENEEDLEDEEDK